MANRLDELNFDMEMQELIEEGLDITVIPKRIRVEKKPSDTVFLWCIRFSGVIFVILGIAMIVTGYSSDAWVAGIVLIILSILPPLLLWFLMGAVKSYFECLEQDINRAAAEVDTYIQARAQHMRSLLKIANMGLEQELKTAIGTAEARSGGDVDARRIYISNSLTNIMTQIEAYPETKSDQYILKMMREDTKHVSNITAARVLYNDKVAIWNREIFGWPIKRIVAAQNGYSTRIPFIASRNIKEADSNGQFMDE